MIATIKYYLLHKIIGIPNLDRIIYNIAVRPSKTELIKAWGKFQECERRYLMFKWVESLNDISNPRFRTLLADSTSSYLLSFEATLQAMKAQIKKVDLKFKLDAWLKELPEYDLKIRGIRTLRHLEAHIEPNTNKSGRKINVIIDSRSVSKSMFWKLPNIDISQWEELKTPSLEVTEISEWNDLVGNISIENIFTDSLRNLRAILEKAELYSVPSAL